MIHSFLPMRYRNPWNQLAVQEVVARTHEGFCQGTSSLLQRGQVPLNRRGVVYSLQRQAPLIRRGATWLIFGGGGGGGGGGTWFHSLGGELCGLSSAETGSTD